MTIIVKAYSNGDHVAVAWLPSGRAAIPGCRGFALSRSRSGTEKYVASFVGFSVVNQEIKGLTEEGAATGAAPVTLVDEAGKTPLRTDLLVPAYIKQHFHAWEGEVEGASSVMVHNKVVVLDPIYGAYHWNTHVTQHATDQAAWHGLEDSDTWQAGHLKDEALAELRFWNQTAGADAQTPEPTRATA